MAKNVGTGRKGVRVHVIPSVTRPGKFVDKRGGNSSTHPTTRHTGKGWSVRKSDSARAERVFHTKEEAVGYARDVARRDGSEVYIHRKDGAIMETHSYGNDPRPPRR